MAVSTPADLILTPLDSQIPGTGKATAFEQGAHGVIACRRGGFIAPLGIKGVMHLRPNDLFTPHIFSLEGLDIYYYRLTSVGITDSGIEFFSGAVRRDGILTISIDSEVTPEEIRMSVRRSPAGTQETDIVDVCTIQSSEHSFAVLALGKDNSLHFTIDIRKASPFVTLHMPEMRGTAYTVLAAQGHVFLLTSKEFYVFPYLGSRFLSGERISNTASVWRRPVDAFDFSIAYEEFILLIKADSVEVVEISRLRLGADPHSGLRAPSKMDSGLNGLSEMSLDVDESSWNSSASSVLVPG